LCAFEIANGICNFSLSAFASPLIKDFGFSGVQIVLLQMPTGAFIAYIEPILGYMATRVPNSVTWVNLLGYIFNVAGLIEILFIERIPGNKWALLGCTWLQSIFEVTNLLSWPLTASTFAGHSKKILASAMSFAFRAVCNLIRPHFFFPCQAPMYHSDLIRLLLYFGIIILLVLALRFYMDWQNRKSD
jgi:hypothetical protein